MALGESYVLHDIPRQHGCYRECLAPFHTKIALMAKNKNGISGADPIYNLTATDQCEINL